MLSKLQSDCEYYLGYGNRSPSILCNHSVQNHIARMKELWNGFPTDQKPEWLTWEQLLQYEKVMTETGIPAQTRQFIIYQKLPSILSIHILI